MAHDFVERMKTEQAELQDRIDKLVTFSGARAGYDLPQIERELLHSQHEAMMSYLRTLSVRLWIYTAKEALKAHGASSP